MSSPADRRSIGAFGAFVEGWRRVLRAPVMCVGVLISITVASMASSSYGDGIDLYRHSLETSRMLRSTVQGQFIGSFPTFTDPLTVAGPVQTPSMAWVAAGALTRYVGLWLFLWGGILDRLARDRRVGTAGFFAACGVYFFRFLRLAVPVALAYWAIFRWLQNSVVIYVVAMIAVILLADFAKVRAVVEDRRSMVGALVASFRFIRRNALDVVGLYVFFLGAFFLWFAVTGAAAQWSFMGDWRLGIPVFTILAIVAFYTRLALAASQVALFQNALAHAEYTAAPVPEWPDSPAAEAIENLRGSDQRGV